MPTTHDAASLTTCLQSWPRETCSEAKDSVIELTQTKGWVYLDRAVEARRRELHASLVNHVKPLESPAEYEKVLGEIRGLDSIQALVNGMILMGEEAEAELREEIRG